MPGLSTAEAADRLAASGPNAIPEPAGTPAWRRVVAQFTSALVAILVVALLVDLGLWVREGARGLPVEATAIAVILLLNAALGLYQERRSEAALARLRALAAAQAWAWRDGALTRVPSDQLVPGDVVRLEAGDRVPADGTLTDAHNVLLDESLLTGESVPVDRGTGSEAFSGTLLARGHTLLTITRTGRASAMGRLATMLGEVVAAPTPLERRVAVLGRQIARGVLALAAGLALVGIAAQGVSHAPESLVFAIALAVAAVPEGLPAVLTVALALGVERMARHRAVVRRLSAVEALGSVTVIATDKTGTLTESRMEVRGVDSDDEAHALAAAVLANDAEPSGDAGDPLDVGLLRWAATRGADVAALRARHPVVSDRPFDSAWKFARVTVRAGADHVSYLKGAPEVIIDRCALTPADRERWREAAGAHARDGFRVLALAWGDGEAEEQLRFLGLVRFWDPPRPEVEAAIRTSREAGIRVLMITGDHPATALALARLVGIPGDEAVTGEALDAADDATRRDLIARANVFARVRPEQKLRIVEALQQSGEVVAMTGDGVNDAPALKRSDVGIAMGQRGSDVSREVADLVLLDDNFATIVGAVAEGRGIYANIQTFLRFLFSTNLSEVLVVAGGLLLAAFMGLRDAEGSLVLPLTAAQILWLNLITDGLPALALAFDRTPGVMQAPPREASAPLLDRASLRFVLIAGCLKALLALALLALLPRAGVDPGTARAATFHMMAIGQLLLTYPSRRTRVHPHRNAYLHAAVLSGIAIQVGAALLPVTARLLGGASLPASLWSVVALTAVVAWALAEVTGRLAWRTAD